jgi:SET family sugar efflux transporter-like MFS transporter
MWAGIALGVAAALEVPALLFIGRLSDRFSYIGLIVSGCLAGIAYYFGLAFVTGPILLIALQLLNAWSFAGIAGIGLPLFQEMIPRPGLSTTRSGVTVAGSRACTSASPYPVSAETAIAW